VSPILAGTIGPIVAIERTEISQKGVCGVVAIVIGDIFAQLFKERQIRIKPCPVVATDRCSRAHEISKMKMMVIQVLNRSEARREAIGSVKLRVVLDDLRRIHVSPLSNQFFEGL